LREYCQQKIRISWKENFDLDNLENSFFHEILDQHLG
jgi:hypothetical protein